VCTVWNWGWKKKLEKVKYYKLDNNNKKKNWKKSDRAIKRKIVWGSLNFYEHWGVGGSETKSIIYKIYNNIIIYNRPQGLQLVVTIKSWNLVVIAAKCYQSCI
jgi:hypothetical protein